MNAALDWSPSPFAVDVERRAGGELLLRPRRALGEYPARCMDALEHWARRTPAAVLVARRGADGEWLRLSYGETLRRVRRIAAGLLTRGLSAERPVLILSGNSIEHLLLAFGCNWAGIPYCPVSPAYSQAGSDFAKLRHVVALLSPGMVAAFETPCFAAALAAVVPPDAEILGDATRIAERVLTQFADLEVESGSAEQAAHAATGPESIVKFLLTSGSTGTPKAVITTERMLCSNAVMTREAMPFIADEPPVIVDWLPWNHTFGGSHNVDFVLFNGGALYIDDGKPTPAAFGQTLRNLAEISPTVYFNVPKGFDMLAPELARDPALRRNFYRRLRCTFFAGAGLAAHTWDALDAQALAERGARVPMICGMGATETGPSVTFTTPATARSGAIGLPAAGCLVKLAPVDDKLEIRVRSPSVMPGYWRQSELSAAAFDAEGFYRMGDAVRLRDSADPTRGLLFDGRIAEDFKLASGTWVSVGPLRAALVAALAPLAQDCVIAGLNEDYLGALILLDAAAARAALGVEAAAASLEVLAVHPRLLELLQARLAAHATRHAGSSTRIERAVVLPSAPSLDAGEITDKGSINQRAVLRARAALVRDMYAAEPPAYVIRVR
ncbi:MAG: feruloyl-CoA synthase [Gammaproteobacteria bacterium]|nr:feruloyl-CoA synthase [Gammaproteobacteria bacterium]